MLQAVNNFGESKGWIAYIAPTKALVGQIVRIILPIGHRHLLPQCLWQDENAYPIGF
jgi:hypothetical protein